MTKGVFVGVGLTLIAIAIALPFIIFNMPSESAGEAFGSVVVGIAVMFGLSPLLFIGGVVLVIIGFVKAS